MRSNLALAPAAELRLRKAERADLGALLELEHRVFATDRLSRRKVLLTTQSVLGLAATAMAVLMLTDSLQVWHLVMFGFTQGSAFAFNMPSRQAFAGELVEKASLRSAVSLTNAGQNLSRVAGPSLAGIVLAAPVVEGTVLTAAARPRRLSLYGMSRIAWSLV